LASQIDQEVQSTGRGTEFEVVEFALNGEAADVPVTMDEGGHLFARIEVASRFGREPVIAIGISRADGTTVYGVSSDMDGVRACRIGENRYSMEISFTDLPLLPGAYLVRSHAMDSEAMRLFGTIERGLTVRGESREFGFVRLPHTWTGTAK
jgi:lipopolysaccharide transport system ATP-binding protein